MKYEPFFLLKGIRIFVNGLAFRSVQVRTHKRNPRINKKWRKRYGTREEPCAYELRDPQTKQTIAITMHPVLFQKLKEMYKNDLR